VGSWENCFCSNWLLANFAFYIRNQVLMPATNEIHTLDFKDAFKHHMIEPTHIQCSLQQQRSRTVCQVVCQVVCHYKKGVQRHEQLWGVAKSKAVHHSKGPVLYQVQMGMQDQMGWCVPSQIGCMQIQTDSQCQFYHRLCSHWWMMSSGASYLWQWSYGTLM